MAKHKTVVHYSFQVMKNVLDSLQIKNARITAKLKDHTDSMLDI